MTARNGATAQRRAGVAHRLPRAEDESGTDSRSLACPARADALRPYAGDRLGSFRNRGGDRFVLRPGVRLAMFD